MEELILKKILQNLEDHKKVALVTLTDVGGSTPRDTGSLMLVWENGETYGSIGGGKVEYFVTGEAVEALKQNTDRNFEHSLMPDGDLEMQCGGTVKGFIKIFRPNEKINSLLAIASVTAFWDITEVVDCPVDCSIVIGVCSIRDKSNLLLTPSLITSNWIFSKVSGELINGNSEIFTKELLPPSTIDGVYSIGVSIILFVLFAILLNC